MKTLLAVALVLLGAVVCAAQLTPINADKVAALDKAADQFVARLHQSLDVTAADDLFVPELAALNREYPGDFQPFETPRVSKALLKQLDDATLRHKVLTDYNLHYWTSVLRVANPAASNDPNKFLPPDFLKAARKSKYLKSFAGVKGAGAVTLISPDEMREFLAESDQLGALLKKAVRPDMVASAAFRAANERTQSEFGAPRVMRDAMGIDVAYSLARESMMLVMVEKNGDYKLIALAPLAN